MPTIVRLTFLTVLLSALASAGLTTVQQDSVHGNLEIQPFIVAAPPLSAAVNVNTAPFVTGRGVGFDGVTGLIVGTSQGNFLCSGSLIASRIVLTAAHCLTDDVGNLIASSVTTFFFPQQGGTLTMDSASTALFRINPQWDGDPFEGYDLALVILPGDAPAGTQIYDLWDPSDPINGSEYNAIGFGQRGEGATGATLPSGSRRQGFNSFDFFLNSPRVLMSDFDSGKTANDASCIFAGACDAIGRGLRESSTASGDSGGPVFLNGPHGRRLVGVSSFGARFSDDGTGATPDVDGKLNSSFGELNGFMNLGEHVQWINTTIAEIPEPGTVFLALLAVPLLLAKSRYQRSPNRVKLEE